MARGGRLANPAARTRRGASGRERGHVPGRARLGQIAAGVVATHANPVHTTHTAVDCITYAKHGAIIHVGNCVRKRNATILPMGEACDREVRQRYLNDDGNGPLNYWQVA